MFSPEPTNVFDVCVPLEVVVSGSLVHAVQTIDGPLGLPQLRQVLYLRLLCLERRGGGRWSGNNCKRDTHTLYMYIVQVHSGACVRVRQQSKVFTCTCM